MSADEVMATLHVISECDSLRDDVRTVWGDFRQTLGEIRADFQDCMMDFERASEVWISHAETRMPATFGVSRHPDFVVIPVSSTYGNA